MKNFFDHPLITKAQSLLTVAIFATVVGYFVLRLLGLTPLGPIALFLPFLLSSTLIILSFVGWKPVSAIITLLVIFCGGQFLFGHLLQTPVIGAAWWKEIGLAVIDVFQWVLTVNAEKGPMPEHFFAVFYGVVGLVSVLTNWALPIPLLNMFILIAPLFYIETLANDPAWYLWLMVGLFCVYASYAYRQDSSHRDQRPPLAFGLLLILVTFTLQSFLPAGSFFIPALNELIASHTPEKPSAQVNSFSLAELGFYPQGNLRVGGPVKLSKDTYLTIDAEQDAFYLRGSVYDQFDGKSWSLAAPENLLAFQSNPDFYDDFTSPQAHAFWFETKEARDQALSKGLFRPSLFRIQTTQPTRIIFHGGKPSLLVHLNSKPEAGMPTEEVLQRKNANDAFFYSASGMIVGERAYDDFGLVVQDTVPLVANLWRADAKKALTPKKGKGERAYETLVRQRDPALAKIIYDQKLSFAARLDQMRAHFEKHYKYSLKAKAIPDQQTFIDNFLTNRVGYCVYFATTYSVLLRDIGYQTRYAEGFVVPAQATASGGLSTREISGKQAHAWTEVWVDGMGWLPIEATPVSHVSDISNLNEKTANQPPRPLEPPTTLLPETSDEKNASSDTEKTTEETTAPEESEDAPLLDTAESFVDDPEVPEKQPSLSKTMLFVLCGMIILLFIAFFIWIRLRSHQERLQASSLVKAGKTSPDRFKTILRHVRREISLLDLKFAPADTLPVIVATLDERFTPESGSNTNDIRARVIRLEEILYGGVPATDEDVRQMHAWYVAMAKEYRKKSHTLVWLRNDVLRVKGRPWN